jgi:hypothetical protein
MSALEMPIFNTKFNEKTAFIYCDGVGTNVKTTCSSDGSGNIYHYYNYKSYGLPFDAITLVKDIKAVSQGQPYDKGLFARKKRLEQLVDTIKYYGLKANDKGDVFHKILLIGVSHGSIIMHSALIRLKTRSDISIEDVDKIMQKVYFITIGSPHHPPRLLLSRYEKLDEIRFYNFYHKDDNVLQGLLSRIVLPENVRNPFAPKDNTKIYPNNSMGNVKTRYDILQRECIIQHPLVYLTPIPAKKYHPTLNHISTYIAYPFFRAQIEDQLKSVGDTTSFDDLVNKYGTDRIPNGSELPGEFNYLNAAFYSGILSNLLCMQGSHSGGMRSQHPRIKLVKSNKYYIVRYDKTNKRKYILSKREKVYLRDIRGQYRYVKTH